jgi:hypothetical protein
LLWLLAPRKKKLRLPLRPLRLLKPPLRLPLRLLTLPLPRLLRLLLTLPLRLLRLPLRLLRLLLKPLRLLLLRLLRSNSNRSIEKTGLRAGFFTSIGFAGEYMVGAGRPPYEYTIAVGWAPRARHAFGDKKLIAIRWRGAPAMYSPTNKKPATKAGFFIG